MVFFISRWFFDDEDTVEVISGQNTADFKDEVNYNHYHYYNILT